jgi:hypothetical protein
LHFFCLIFHPKCFLSYFNQQWKKSLYECIHHDDVSAFKQKPEEILKNFFTVCLQKSNDENSNDQWVKIYEWMISSVFALCYNDFIIVKNSHIIVKNNDKKNRDDVDKCDHNQQDNQDDHLEFYVNKISEYYNFYKTNAYWTDVKNYDSRDVTDIIENFDPFQDYPTEKLDTFFK